MAAAWGCSAEKLSSDQCLRKKLIDSATIDPTTGAGLEDIDDPFGDKTLRIGVIVVVVESGPCPYIPYRLGTLGRIVVTTS